MLNVLTALHLECCVASSIRLHTSVHRSHHLVHSKVTEPPFHKPALNTRPVNNMLSGPLQARWRLTASLTVSSTVLRSREARHLALVVTSDAPSNTGFRGLPLTLGCPQTFGRWTLRLEEGISDGSVNHKYNHTVSSGHWDSLHRMAKFRLSSSR